jgi:serine/threonine protein kinase
MPLSSGIRLGPYEILDAIGAGGMGEVYKARDTRLDRIVAIKTSKEQFTERFEREARAVAALNHPNICTLHDVGPNYLVMEFIEGPTLADRIAAGRIPLEEAMPITRQIIDALEAAHEKGIVHRDLKPANIKLTPEGKVKVLDFGLAKAFDNDTGAPSVNSPTLTMGSTRAGVILGTAAYMSPEQARGVTVDRRADIWSFGVVLLEMLTGRATFSGETISDVLAAVLKTDPDWSALPAETPANVLKLLRRCLQRDRRQRLRDIGDARIELDDETPAPTAPAAPRRTSLIPWALAALLLASTAWLAFTAHSPAPVESSFQSSILPPENVSFHRILGRLFAISPDGHMLAFTATQDGRSMLWVRRMDSAAGRVLPGTDNAYDPFWSPEQPVDRLFCGTEIEEDRCCGRASAGHMRRNRWPGRHLESNWNDRFLPDARHVPCTGCRWPSERDRHGNGTGTNSLLALVSARRPQVSLLSKESYRWPRCTHAPIH